MLEEKGIKEVRFEADKKVNVYADEFYIEQALQTILQMQLSIQKK